LKPVNMLSSPFSRPDLSPASPTSLSAGDLS